MKQSEKRRAERLIQLYVNYLESVGHDAGWHGDTIWARWIDYLGDPPPPSGNDVSNLQSIREIQFLRGVHAEIPAILRMMAGIRKTDAPAYQAMVLDTVYRGRTVRVGERFVRQTVDRVAAGLGMDKADYMAAAERGKRKLVALENKRVDRELKAAHALPTTERAL